jgi:hypothetical protein
MCLGRGVPIQRSHSTCSEPDSFLRYLSSVWQLPHRKSELAARISSMLKMTLSTTLGDSTMFPLSRNFLKFAAAGALVALTVLGMNTPGAEPRISPRWLAFLDFPAQMNLV